MEIASFRDLYLAELQELRSLATQFNHIMQKMTDAASEPLLKDILRRQLLEADAERDRIGHLLTRHNVPADAHTDQGMEALAREADKMISLVRSEAVRDVAIIGSVQRLEHYQMAAYGTAAALAGQLDFRSDQEVLHSALERKRRADVQLTELAKGRLNPRAVAA